eukprot:g4196.t1 g4196   contig15:541213-542237(-)
MCSTWTVSSGHQQLLVKSAFIKDSSKQTFLSSPSSSCNFLESFDDTINTQQNNVLEVRGGSSYDNYNDGYGDDNAPNNDGEYNNDYYNQDGYVQPSGRDGYDDDYFRGSNSGGSGYYDDEGRYREDYDDRGGRGSQRRKSSSPPKLPTVLTSSNRKLGIIFLSSGAAFTALGITLFFNKTLMRLGNLLFVCGIPLMLGPGRTVGYFLQPKKARATGCLGCGIFLVLVGHPVIGILLEVFGLLNLFGNMFPLVMMMAKNLPVVGGLFSGNNGSGGSRKERRRRESDYDDRYFEDERYGDRDYRQEERY